MNLQWHKPLRNFILSVWCNSFHDKRSFVIAQKGLSYLALNGGLNPPLKPHFWEAFNEGFDQFKSPYKRSFDKIGRQTFL